MQSKLKRELLVAAATSALMVLPVCATAADAQAQPASGAVTANTAPAAGDNATAASTGPEQETIVVTARRRSENIQKVPVSVIALSSEDLTERAIASPLDLNKIAPGLSVNGDSGNSVVGDYSIRGRGVTVGSSASSVETYFAEVPLSPPFGMFSLPPQLFDLQSVQVLKGPQGTLFGRSTTGGAVLFVPQAPTDQFEGYLRAQAGDYGDTQFEGAINFPIVGDKVMLRVSAFDWQRDGYDHTTGGLTDPFGQVLPVQTYDNQDVQEIRATLLVRPFEWLENSTIVTDHSDSDRESANAALLRTGLETAAVPPGYQPRISESDVDLTRPPENAFAVINTTTFTLIPDVTVKNIFGYINGRGYTGDATNLDGLGSALIDLFLPPRPRQNTQTTEELQFQGQLFDDRLTWLLGGIVDDTREPGGNNDIPIAEYGDVFGGFTTRFAQNNVSSEGIYGSATYRVTNQINLTAGYRHSWDDVLQRILTVPGLQASVPTATPVPTNSKSFEGNSDNIGIDYTPTDGVMAYGGYRRGYKRGGFSFTSNAGPDNFAPESDNDYYVGAKTTFSVDNMSGIFNIEFFYDNYFNEQANELSLVGGQLSSLTVNAPAATYKGFDLDLVLEPTDWMTLTGNYSFVDAYFTKWPDTSVPNSTVNLALNPEPETSKNKFTISPKFHADLGDGLGELVFEPSYTYQTKLYVTAPSAVLPQAERNAIDGGFNFNAVALGGDTVPSYGVLDLRFEWNHVMNSKFDIAANVTNLLNKTYITTVLPTLEDGFQADAYGPPRMFSFEVSTKF
jgi:iron complex outermembrane recepter protein